MADLGPFEWMRDVMGDDEDENVYAELSSGGSPRGRAVAATVSYRAREYSPDFFTVADRPALASCAQLFDQYPWLTVSLAVQAVETLRGRPAISAMDIVGRAQILDTEPGEPGQGFG